MLGLEINATHSWPIRRMFTDYTAEKVQTLCASRDELRIFSLAASNGERAGVRRRISQRADIIHQLAERGIDFPQVALQAGKPDAAPFDLLCHLAFNARLLTRRSRAEGHAGFVMVNGTTSAHSCSMKLTKDVRKHAAEPGIAEEETLKRGMEEKPKEFVEKGCGGLREGMTA
ncbi:MAG: hypothetical protein HYY24_00225 [Verrucomicrobia bacterium]|nr:hypothetical protein [Verrucomicrobiota bacterium]